MPYIEVNGRRIFYVAHPSKERDQKAPMVLVHGAGGSHLVWPPQLRRFPGRTVFALDLPGHGRSEGDGCVSIAACRDAVLSWADAVGLSSFVLVGHSMGGAIAQEVALTQPDRLAALVLMATGARLRVHPRILQGLLEDYAATARLLVEWAYGKAAAPELSAAFVRELLQTPAEVTYRDFAACNVWDRMADVHRIRVPTLILVGSEDKLTPPKYATFLHEHIAGSQLAVIPDAGHMLMLEAPEAVAAEIRRFLEALEEGE